MPRKDPAQQLATLKARNDLAAERVRAAKIGLASKAMKAYVKAATSMSRPHHGPHRMDRYAAATRTRLRPGPRPSGGSSAFHLTATVQGSLRRDCQDLKRNSSAARIVISRAAQIIVGDGPIVTSTTPDKKWNEKADRLWNTWFDALDPDMVGHPDIAQRLSGAEMLANAVSAWCTDGDILFVRTRDSDRRGCLQVIEGERVLTPSSAGVRVQRDDGGSIVDGVEMNAAGAAQRYHVADWDPAGYLRPDRTRAVPADAARMLINPIGVEGGMVRGAPALQACLDRIERLDSYDESTAVAAEIATRFCAIVTSDNAAGYKEAYESGTDDQPDRSNTDSPQTVEMQAGLIHYLDKGAHVHAMDPKFPTTNFRDYVLWHYMILGAEIGLPVVASLFDATGLSWSNIKALLSMSMRSIEPGQARLARLTRWARNWKTREWIETGELNAIDDYHLCQIDMPRAPVVDFKSEVEGHILAINNNLETQEQATQALGTGRSADIRSTRELERGDEIDKNIVPQAMPGAKPAGEDTTKAPKTPEEVKA